MSKIANMLNMVYILRDKKVHSIKELAKRLEVSERMIRVYKSELEQSGIYINGIKGKYGGYILDNERNNLDIGLTFEEINLLNNISKNIKTNNSNLLKVIEKINHAYKNNIKENDEKKLKLLYNKNKEISVIYKNFRNAINNKNKIFIEFDSVNSGRTSRVIHPSEIFLYLNDWYIAAFCELRNEIRLFKLKDIFKYEILKEKYNENFNIKIEN